MTEVTEAAKALLRWISRYEYVCVVDWPKPPSQYAELMAAHLIEGVPEKTKEGPLGHFAWRVSPAGFSVLQQECGK